MPRKGGRDTQIDIEKCKHAAKIAYPTKIEFLRYSRSVKIGPGLIAPSDFQKV